MTKTHTIDSTGHISLMSSAALRSLVTLLGLLMVVGQLKAAPMGIPPPQQIHPRPRTPDLHAHNSMLEDATPTPIYLPTPPPHLNFTTPAPRVGSALHAVKFMQQFGYVPQGDDKAELVFTEHALSSALKRLQKFGAIPQTGVIDNETIALMQTPRCGLPDVEPEDIAGNNHRRRKRYILGAEGWKKRRLTYFVANWSPKLWNIENVKKELRRAFDAWSTYSHLKFTEVPGPEADIVIFFASYDHHDGYAFDGPSGILAHAYYPYEFGHYGGDVHFDESEDWTIDPKDEYSGLDFFTVAVHEIGHSLGLAHSPVSGSIMFPYYKGYNKEFSLDYDDVMAMWELYIKRKLEDDDEYFNSQSNATTTTTTATTPTGADDDEVTQSDAAADEDDESGKGVDSNDEGVLSDEPIEGDDEDEGRVSKDDYNDDDKYEDDEDEIVRYHGDYDTVDEHQRKRKEEREGDLPHLPNLPPEGDDVYEEEEEKRREEERRREKEEEEERRRWEEEIRRREAETRRREEEARRRWEEEDEDSQTTPRPPQPLPDICHGSYDAVAVLRQELFIFKGEYMWRYSDRGVLRPGYPAQIRSLFEDLPSYLKKIDAVYQRPTDSSFVFFIGKYYYVHNGVTLIEDSPRPLSDLGIPNLYTKIDAAFYWPRAKRTYFFSRNSYFRYDDMTGKMDEGYPRDIKKWNGIPGDLDAVFTWKDDTSYFLRGYQFWRYDNAKIRPAKGYPQDATQYWANCPAQS